MKLSLNTRIINARGGLDPLVNPIRMDQIRRGIGSAVTPASIVEAIYNYR